MAKPKHFWEDDTKSKDGSCAVCKKCRIALVSGRCMYGGPFKNYAKVVYGRRQGTEEEGTEEEGTGGTEEAQ